MSRSCRRPCPCTIVVALGAQDEASFTKALKYIARMCGIRWPVHMVKSIAEQPSYGARLDIVIEVDHSIRRPPNSKMDRHVLQLSLTVGVASYCMIYTRPYCQ
jgi:hypothetical protein